MEAKLAKLNAKLALLDLTRGKTDGIVGTGIVEKIRGQKEALQAIVGSTEELKREVEEAKLENGESLDKVKEWGQEIEERIDIVDNEIKVLETRVKSAITEAENTEREKQENPLAREREEQLKFERKQLEQKEEFSSKLKDSTQNLPSHSSKQSVKLLKLVITKYNGALENWLSFWKKFEAETLSTMQVKTSMPPPLSILNFLKTLFDFCTCQNSSRTLKRFNGRLEQFQYLSNFPYIVYASVDQMVQG